MNAFLSVVNLFFDPETAHHLKQGVTLSSVAPFWLWVAFWVAFLTSLMQKGVALNKLGWVP